MQDLCVFLFTCFLIRRRLFVGVIANLFLEGVHVVIRDLHELGPLHRIRQFPVSSISRIVEGLGRERKLFNGLLTDRGEVLRQNRIGVIQKFSLCDAYFRHINLLITLLGSIFTLSRPVCKGRKHVVTGWPNLHNLGCSDTLRD